MSLKPFFLNIAGVNKAFAGFPAITNLNFHLAEGELRTIIGPSGAGKSTIMDIIAGRTKADTGRVDFGADNDLTALNEREINRLGIGRKLQSPAVYLQHTVFDNLWLAIKNSQTLFTAWFGRITPAQRDHIASVLQVVGLSSLTAAFAGSLSHGQKQWLEIGMLLIVGTKLLLVDEPAAGMTDAETHQTGELLLSLEGKHSIIVIEHDLTFVRQLARKVTLLHKGSILCEGTLDEVQNQETANAVFAGVKKKN